MTTSFIVAVRNTGVAICVLTSVPSASPEQPIAASTLKAAFTLNFAKFTEWPALPSGAPLNLCVVGDEGIAATLTETARGQNIGGHTLAVSRPRDSGSWLTCHVLFIAESETPRSAAGLAGIKAQPVLTISDAKGFAQAGGIIELYVEAGRMRFAINVDAAERAGLRLSSRLLGLAKVVRSERVQ